MFKRLRNFRSLLALFLILIPIILILFTGEVRSSISNYAYAKYCVLLPIILTLASVLFLLDSVLDKHKWYNTILGISLIGVALTPHLDYNVLHYTFAGIFFIGSIIVMILFSSKKQKVIKIILGSIIGIGLILSFLGYYSLLIGEWIVLLPISIHYIGEVFGKID